MAKIKDLYDNNAEAMILSTLVFHPDYSLSSEKLLPEYFHDKFNEAIYWGIGELYRTKIKKIDYASLDAVIKTKYGDNILDPARCAEFLELANEFARDTLEEYMLFVNRVITCAYKRELIRKTEEIQRVCMKDGSEVLDVQEKMRELTMQLTEKFSVGAEDKLFGEVIQEMWAESRRKLVENGGASGLQFKFTKLNEYCTLEKSELIVVAAKRKVGKSAFCLSEALNQVEKGKKVLYLDTELRSSQFMDRILSNKAQIDNHSLKNNNLSEKEKERLQETLHWFAKNKNFTHIYRPSWTPEQIYSCVLYWSQKWGKVELLIYDYLKSSGSNASESYAELGNLTNFLKNNIAGAFDIPVLAAAQLNRGGDIGDSFKVEQYSSVILNLDKKTEREIENDNNLGFLDLGTYKMKVKCNRLGEAHDYDNEYIDLKFDGNHFNFQDIPNSPIIHPKATPYD